MQSAESKSNQACAEDGLLAKVEAPGYSLRLDLCHNQLGCRGSIDVIDADKAPGYDVLVTILARYGVKNNLEESELQLFCNKAAQGVNQTDVLMARGTEPVEGEPGWLDFKVRTANAEAEFWEDEGGCIDLRTRHTFSNVTAGQVIGEIQPPGRGEPGLTVHGLVIPAVCGPPLILKCGAGTKLGEDEKTVIATEAGRVIYEKQHISVSDEMIVSGDLDLEIGNIDFSGFVEIRGDVLDDFSIRAERGIKVKGTVGACRLETEGSVEIGSMAGLGRGAVFCQGDFTAHHVIEATIECHGQVKVATEIRNSVIRSAGRISIEKGAILGGEAIALEGIEAKQLGTRTGVETELTAGVFFPAEQVLRDCQAEIEALQQKVERIDTAVGPLGEGKNDGEELPQAIALRIEVLQKYRQTSEAQIEGKLQEMVRRGKDAHPNANAKINASQVIHEGVTVRLGEGSLCFADRHQGATSLIENTYAGGIRILPLTSLRVPAEKLEGKARQEDRLAAERAALES